jgi:hypothetical protein
MPTTEIVQLLITERDRLTRAIEVLQGPTRRRGRPPKSPMAASPNGSDPASSKKHTRTFTAAQRKAQSQRLKAYWRNKRKEAGKKA